MAEFNEDFDGITITEINQTDDSWTFMVELGHGEGAAEYMIDLDREYWTKMTARRIEPADFVILTFKFLLEKETKELILKRFNMSDVAGHYPSFELEVKRRL